MCRVHPTRAPRWSLHISYDYTRYVLRTEPSYSLSAAAPDLGSQDIDLAAAMSGEFDATAPVIAGIWQQLTPDTRALDEMLVVIHAFTRFATRRGARTWQAIPTKVIHEFSCLPDPMITDSARKLGKNAVHGAYLALTDAALLGATSPARGVHWAPTTRGVSPVAGRDPVHLRPATYEEILLTRLACRLAGTGRTQHLPAATVALHLHGHDQRSRPGALAGPGRGRRRHPGRSPGSNARERKTDRCPYCDVGPVGRPGPRNVAHRTQRPPTGGPRRFGALRREPDVDQQHRAGLRRPADRQGNGPR